MDLQHRISGVLLPLSSLPGSPCCGDLGAGARRFVDFLHKAGQRAWQMLPPNPIDDCFSPYASISTFAADPIYIDLEDLARERLLDPDDIASLPDAPKTRTVYHVARDVRMQRLRKAFQRFRETAGTKYHLSFEPFVNNNPWVGPHAMFCALSEKYGTVDWTHWPDKRIRHAEQAALKEVHAELEDPIAFQTFVQLLFDVQWTELHDYCRQRGIGLIGDVPIYVSKCSVDTWAEPQLFQLNPEGEMQRIAGVPGDSFNPDGQRWNSPLYDWTAHKTEAFAWWVYRLRTALKRFDAIRLDHFIGFYNYFSMSPQPDPNDQGFWVPGPSGELFDTLLGEIPDAQFIAEDLGVMKQGVHDLRDRYGFPGMNVFQFNFDFRRSTDPTVEWKRNSVVCTGTHDTDTLAAWVDEVLADRKRPEPFWDIRFMLDMLRPFIPQGEQLNRKTIIQAIIRKVMSSPGNVSIFPMQDLLGLPTEARMNFPGHATGNWVWRLDEAYLTDELANRLRDWTNEFGR